MYYNAYYDYSRNDIHIFDDEEGIITNKYRPYCWYKTSEQTEFKTIFGTPVKKVELSENLKSDKDAYEVDISPETRVLVDKYHAEDRIAKNRIMILDIEVSSIGGFANQDTANKKITAIATVMLNDKKRVVFVLDEQNKFTLEKSEQVKYVVCATEKDLLAKFMAYFTLVAKPTVISGWYSFQFDLPYLYRRLRRVFSEEFANKLSPIGIVKEQVINFSLKNEIYNGFKIAGISHLDYIILYKKYSINDKPMYNLEFISNEELGKGKVKYDGSLDDLYEKDINKFIEYNLTDIELIVELEEKLHYIEIAIGMCHKGCISYDNVFQQSKIIEGAFLVFFKEHNLVALNKPENEKSRFPGAYVKEPIPGRYKWLYSCDLTSLYPSIIRTLNISPETKFGKIIRTNPINGDVTLELISGTVKETTSEKFNEFLIKNNIRKSSSDVLYRSDKQGFIPAIIERWFNERVAYKKLKKKAKDEGNKEDEKQYDIKQYVTKILLNSVYGVLGLSSFRFYDRDNALSVTSTGQEILKFSERNVNKFYSILGAKKQDDYIIYGDTDSIYVSAMSLAPEGITNNNMLYLTRVVANVMTKALNFELKRFSEELLNSKENYLVFNQEAICYSALWSKKKKYALYILDDEGFVKLKDGKTVASGFKLPQKTIETLTDLKLWINSNTFVEDDMGIPVDSLSPKMKVKGLDTIKSDFPNAFKTVLKTVLVDILEFKEEEEIKNVIKEFKGKLEEFSIIDVAIPKGVKDIEKYYDEKSLYKKGAPINVKSAINYNAFLTKYNLKGTYREMVSGDKLKFVHLKKNEFNFDTIGFKNDVIPKELEHFVSKYIDKNSIFESVLFNKLQDFWTILGWGTLYLNKNMLSNFF